MSSRSTLVLQSLVTLFLVALFYAISLATIGGCLYIAALGFEAIHRGIAGGGVAYMIAGGLVGAILVLLSILPRRDRFDPPGPRIDLSNHPGLQQFILAIASDLHQRLPDDTYLTADVNAGVLDRGGFLGIGRRRVLFLGVPLMGVLTASQFRFVLAHEFGHFHHGDTLLGGWIHAARSSIVRAVEALAGFSALLHLPFYLYAVVFLRLTRNICRHRELMADGLAAEMAGSNISSEALMSSLAAGVAIDSYVGGVMPILKAGYRPPFLVGFRAFCKSPEVAEQIARAVRRVLARGAGPYDTHPAVSERLEFLRKLPAKEPPPSDPPAITLLEGLEAIEHSVVETLFVIKRQRTFKPIAWEEIISKIYLPSWIEDHARFGPRLNGLTPRQLPDCAAGITDFGATLFERRGVKEPRFTTEEARDRAYRAVGSALTFALLKRGWTFEPFKPGEPVAMRNQGITVLPFDALTDLVRLDQKRVSAAEWRARCEELGIADLDLSEPYAAA
ncbi:MAG TPA: M48 family metallopeptidase [Planctomycetota bacterium]|nr:M48 family metallopeptidase [Planctomycetota bacterium]